MILSPIRNPAQCVVLGILLTCAGEGSVERTHQVEPVRFSPFQTALFQDGGTLTDAWADFDGDGDPDRFVGFNGTSSRLYRNDMTNGFSDVSEEVGLMVSRSVRTSAWGDFDADGDPDLLLGFTGEAPVTALYRNDDGRGFTEVADEVGLLLVEGTPRQAAWIDYDGDGDLDLFLALRDRANRLFRNDGSSSFSDVTEQTGIGDTRRTVGAVWLDVDQDGDFDLVTANMNGDANGLWANEGGRFTDSGGRLTVASGGRGLGDASLGSVRVCAVDANTDGAFDLFFANYGPNALLLATAPGRWGGPEVVPSLAVDGRYDTCVWGDFDHDGTVDLYVNGTITGGVQHRDWLFRREGSPAFVDVTPPNILALNASHGATWVDFDLDGDLDLALTGAAPDGMHYLMQNDLSDEAGARSLQVRVLDGNGHATRAGAEVRVFEAGTDRLLGLRLIDTGSGYDAQSDLPAHFGFPRVAAVDISVTTAVSGRRVTGSINDVRPVTYRNGVLTLRMDETGRISQSP